MSDAVRRAIDNGDIVVMGSCALVPMTQGRGFMWFFRCHDGSVEVTDDPGFAARLIRAAASLPQTLAYWFGRDPARVFRLGWGHAPRSAEGARRHALDATRKNNPRRRNPSCRNPSRRNPARRRAR